MKGTALVRIQTGVDMGVDCHLGSRVGLERGGVAMGKEVRIIVLGSLVASCFGMAV